MGKRDRRDGPSWSLKHERSMLHLCIAILLLSHGCCAFDMTSMLGKLREFSVAGRRAVPNANSAFVLPSVSGFLGRQISPAVCTSQFRSESALCQYGEINHINGFLASLTMKVAPHHRPIKKSLKTTGKVLVLNPSYEPLSVVSTRRALTLLWSNKASLVVAKDKMLKSCSGSEVQVPSVVCLRRYIKAQPKMPALNRRTVFMRDGGRCQYCGKKADNVDHVLPRCRGGGSTWENVVASCSPCNTRKAGFLLKDTNLKLRKMPGPPRHVSWVYAAVRQVDERWKPYIGEVAWDLELESTRETRRKGVIEAPSARRKGGGAASPGDGRAGHAPPRVQHSKGAQDSGVSERIAADKVADSAIAVYSHGSGGGQ